MTVHIFRYSQLIDTNEMSTISKFATATGLSEGIIGKIATTEKKRKWDNFTI